jgi:hypothetical protein
MAAGKGQRWGLIALVVLAVLIVGGIVGFRVAVGVLRSVDLVALQPYLIRPPRRVFRRAPSTSTCNRT